MGETVVRGLFENAKWDEQIPFRYLFEFSMERPTALEIKKSGFSQNSLRMRDEVLHYKC
jgi:hypothetical protein